MGSRIKLLNDIRRKDCTTKKKEASLDHIKDVLIAHLQTIFSGEIVDIDIGLPDPVPMKIYLRKEGRKKT